MPAPSGRVWRHIQAYVCACDACACTNMACADSCPAGSFRGGWHQCVPGKSRRCCHAHSRRAWYICQAPFPSGHAHLHRSHPRARVQRPPGAIALPLSIPLVDDESTLPHLPFGCFCLRIKKKKIYFENLKKKSLMSLIVISYSLQIVQNLLQKWSRFCKDIL